MKMRKIQSLMILFMIFSVQAYSQDDDMDKYLEQRREVIKKMLGAFEEDLDVDNFFNDADHFSNKFGQNFNSSVAVEKKTDAKGNIEVIVTPKNENVKIDIQAKTDAIHITSETKIEETLEQEGNTSKSYSISKYSNIVPIPKDYKAIGPEKNGKALVIKMIPKKGARIHTDSKGDDTAPVFKSLDMQETL